MFAWVVRSCLPVGFIALTITLPSFGCKQAGQFRPWKERPFFSRFFREADAKPPTETTAPAALTTLEVAPAPARQPQSILALSGGGSYGAFTAGVLNGWSRTNQRPEFDVVTGISTGALIAPLAFLGPKYDPEMRRFYTEVKQRDVFTLRFWATIPFRDAAGSTAPLRRLIESGVTPEFVEEIAREHQKGRRLYIGTTRLETRKSVIWDIGAIACQGGPESRQLICDILVASAAVPGVFPPVAITVEADGQKRTELHVDGGVTAPVFVPTNVLESAPQGADLFIVLAGKQFPDSDKVRARVLRVLSASGGALLRAHTRRDVSNLYHMSQLHGLRFHMVSLRQDFPVNDSAIEFDPDTMNQLAGPIWNTTPPERGPGDDGDIRTGSRVRK
jgi:predicted acylesterase/phospholipase RssA